MRIDSKPLHEDKSITGPLVLPSVVTPLEPLTKPLSKTEFEAHKPHHDTDAEAPLDIEQTKEEISELIEQTAPQTVQHNASTLPTPHQIKKSEEEEIRLDGAVALAEKTLEWVTQDKPFAGGDLLELVMGLGKTPKVSHDGEDEGTESDGLDLDEEALNDLAEAIDKMKPKSKDEYDTEQLRKKLDARVAELMRKADELEATLDLTAVTLGPSVSSLFAEFAEIANQLAAEMYKVLQKVHQADKLDNDIFQTFADKLDNNNDYNAEMLNKLNRNSKLQLKMVMQMIAGKLFQQMEALYPGTDPNNRPPAALQMVQQLRDNIYIG